MQPQPVIVWFRNDLRLEGNLALSAALSSQKPVIPVFIWNDKSSDCTFNGPHSERWLGVSLRHLSDSLNHLGSRLIIRTGCAPKELRDLASETHADHVYFNERYEPSEIQTQSLVEEALRPQNIVLKAFNSNYLFDPRTIYKANNHPYKKFGAFWKHCLTLKEPNPLPLPLRSEQFSSPMLWPNTVQLTEMNEGSSFREVSCIKPMWTPGEASSNRKLKEFLLTSYEYYSENRERSDITGTSMLSPHLSFGEIGPTQILQELDQQKLKATASVTLHEDKFITELGWREFANYIITHFPASNSEPSNTALDHFIWDDNKYHLTAWQSGETGYPIIDAAMRQLKSTGWMNNRLRMVVASFLIKNLLIPWQKGAEWFSYLLVDANEASNNLGWKWIAGCGTDSSPYFRIFNPLTQSQKTDHDGSFIHQWIPELSQLAEPWIHHPWLAPIDVLQRAQISLDVDYPRPIVDYKTSRIRSLAAYKQAKLLYDLERKHN